MPTGDNYYSLVSRAIAELQSNTHNARLTMYERARTSLDEQLATSNQTTGTIFRQRQSLERAIRRVENMHANADKVQLAWSSIGLKKWLDYQVADVIKVFVILFPVGVGIFLFVYFIFVSSGWRG
jgi:hypothetical protein